MRRVCVMLSFSVYTKRTTRSVVGAFLGVGVFNCSSPTDLLHGHFKMAESLANAQFDFNTDNLELEH